MRTTWNNLSGSIRGTILLLLAMLLLTGMLILIRIGGQTLPVVQVMFARAFIMQLMLLIHAGPAARYILRTRHLKLQLLRAALSFGATFCSFVAVIYLPLALGTAISFSYAIFVTIGAAIFLKEKVDLQHWIVTVLGLVGVIIMLSPIQPGGAWFIALAVVGAVLSAGMVLSVRAMSPDEPMGTVLTYQGILTMPILLVPMLLTWQTPTAMEWLLLLVIGVIGTVGQWLLVSAFQQAEAAKLAPLDFVRLIMMTVCGLAFFGETINLTLAIGMVVVLLTTLYTVRVNAAKARLLTAES